MIMVDSVLFVWIVLDVWKYCFVNIFFVNDVFLVIRGNMSWMMNFDVYYVECW